MGRPRRSALLLLAALPGCLLLSGRPAIPECPGVLLPTQRIEGEFLLRQRVRLRSVDRAAPEAALQLAVQKRGTELVLVGFDPLGARLLSVVQRGEEVEVESLPGRVLPTAPLNLLRDLHRVRFLALGPPAGGEGRVEGSFADTRVSEEWSGGRLRVRSFERRGGSGAQPVRVFFDEGGESGARIENPACGYRATWTRISEEALP